LLHVKPQAACACTNAIKQVKKYTFIYQHINFISIHILKEQIRFQTENVYDAI